MSRAFALLVGLAACAKDAPRPCGERVQAMSARLASPRPLEEIVASAPSDVRRHLDPLTARFLFERIGQELAACEDGVATIQDLVASDTMEATLQERVPAALEACRCEASPERVGLYAELLLSARRSR